jgi:CheY-like chemotaxis protein
LLTNAIKFTPPHGEVKVSLGLTEGLATLQVSDNGRGIDPRFLPSVFARFSQEDSTVTRTHGGLGLGLAIAHHLVEMHGGTIRAESAGLDQGACFTVSLPLRKSEKPAIEPGPTSLNGRRGAPSTPTRSDPAIDVGELAHLRILVVDDDAGAREAVSDMLAGTGAEVQVAASAAAGLAAIEAFRPSVVLCDVAMPDEDGYSFIRRLRALGPGRGGAIPALALTALAGEDDRLRALAAGFQMHITKPVSMHRLTQAVVALSHAALWPTTSTQVPLEK